MLELARVTKDYAAPGGAIRVLDEVNLVLSPGDAAAITGPSGSGKSSLLYVIGALEPPTTGRVTLDGVEPYGLPPSRLADFRNERIGFVFQDHCLLPQLSVLENVLVPTFVARDRHKTSAADSLEFARELVAQVGLTHRIDQRPAALSGGERQRVAVARALVLKPRLLLADEPTGNLDAETAASVTQLLLDLHRAHGSILVVVTHSAAVASAMPARLELAHGRLTRVSS